VLFDEWEIELHGHRVIYRIAGDGPPVVLIHGMVNSSRHWEEVALRLADRYTVVAPDLLGHGDSAAVRGDYSLGGGIAMQFFYQFPQRVERLALISSGGLGHEVSPMLRGAALPGAATGIWLVANRRVRSALERAGGRMRERGSRKGVYLEAVARAMRPLQDAAARRAFVQTLRSVIDVRGQHVSAIDRLYLLGELPTLLVWGERDNTIPMEHGLAAHELIPNSRFVTLPKAAHFPNLEDPRGLADALLDWLDSTEPGLIEDSEWGQIVGARSPRRQRFSPEGPTPSSARPSGWPE